MADEASRNAKEPSRTAEQHSRSALSTAHDLNNLFQVIMGSLEVLKRGRGEVPPETVETALRATREAATLAQRLLASLKRPGGEPARARAGETILLVEDNADVRRWAAAALESLGYRVLQAADGTAALELVQSPAAHRVDLLFTDVELAGGMTGRALAEAVSARRPGLSVLFTSELEKPYDVERLSTTVRAIIDAR
jgi:CheY-like chemotaxis protein